MANRRLADWIYGWKRITSIIGIIWPADVQELREVITSSQMERMNVGIFQTEAISRTHRCDGRLYNLYLQKRRSLPSATSVPW